MKRLNGLSFPKYQYNTRRLDRMSGHMLWGGAIVGIFITPMLVPVMNLVMFGGLVGKLHCAIRYRNMRKFLEGKIR